MITVFPMPDPIVLPFILTIQVVLILSLFFLFFRYFSPGIAEGGDPIEYKPSR